MCIRDSGATVLYGYKYALKNGADYIFQTDSDGQTLPEEFEPFWLSLIHIQMCIRDSLGRIAAVEDLYVAHTKAAIDSLGASDDAAAEDTNAEAAGDSADDAQADDAAETTADTAQADAE